MNTASLFLTFLMIWWIVFFMALPIGIKREDAPVKGQASSAPKNPNLWWKALITTLIAACLTALAAYLVDQQVFDITGITR